MELSLFLEYCNGLKNGHQPKITVEYEYVCLTNQRKNFRQNLLRVLNE